MTEPFQIPKSAARFAYYLVVFLFGLESLYVLSVFVFLTSPIFGKVIQNHPHDMEISISAGWSWLPGRVHLRQAVIAGEDKNVRWRIEIPSATCQISLHELFARRIHLLNFQSPRGLSFELHLKTLANNAVLPPSTDRETLAQKKSGRWLLVVDHIRLSQLRRLQIEDWVYRGGADIDGSFELWPGIEARIGPANLVLKDGRLNDASQGAAERGLLEDVTGQVAVQIDKFSTSNTSSSGVLKYVNCEINLTSNARSVSWINRFIIRNSALSLEKGNGTLSADLVVRHGALMDRSKVSLDTSEIVLSAGRLIARGKGRIRGEVRGDETNLVLRLRDLKLESGETGYELANADELVLSVMSPDLDLRGAFASRYFYARVAQCPPVA